MLTTISVLLNKVRATFSVTRADGVERIELYDEPRVPPDSPFRYSSKSRFTLQYRDGQWQPDIYFDYGDDMYYLASEGENNLAFIKDATGNKTIPIFIQIVASGDYMADLQGEIKFYFSYVEEVGPGQYTSKVPGAWVQSVDVADAVQFEPHRETVWLDISDVPNKQIKLHQITNAAVGTSSVDGLKKRLSFYVEISTLSSIGSVEVQYDIADEEVPIPLRNSVIENWPD